MDKKTKPEVAFVSRVHQSRGAGLRGAGMLGCTQEVVPARSLPVMLSSLLVPEAVQT